MGRSKSGFRRDVRRRGSRWALRQTCINQVLERKRGGEVKSGEG